MNKDLGKILLNDDAQPTMRWLNHKRITVRSIDELLGICKGMTADDNINQKEAEYILSWLQNNQQAANTWPGNVITKRIAYHLQDGILDPEESADLLHLLRDITGENYEVMTAGNMSTSCFDKPQPPIIFTNKQFCLTGKFAMGPRKACEQEIKDRGGKTGNLLAATDYLIIGCIGSTDWIHTSYGRKIEKVKTWQQQGRSIAIISEDHWAAHL